MQQNKDKKIKIKIKKIKKIEKGEKGEKSWILKPKRVKNKYNMIGWWIKRSQYLKTIFATIKTKTLTRYGKKVDFLIRSLDHIEFWIIL